MAVVIKKVENRKDMRAFINLPFSIYKGNKNWIPPLLSDEYKTLDKKANPAFEHSEAEYWLAYKEGKAVGRIIGIISHPANEKWGIKTGRFGWVDFIDDPEVVSALFETAETWCRDKGMDKIVGPMGFCDFDPEGMLVEGFDELGTLPMIYNHAYYPEHMTALGYEKEVDWLEFEVMVPKDMPQKVLRVNELVLKRTGLKLAKPKNRKELVGKYGKSLFKVLEEGYEELYGSVPITEKQIQFFIDQYLGFVDLKFTHVIVDDQDEVAAVGVAMPSLSVALQRSKGRIFPFGWFHLLQALKKPRMIDLYLVAVRKKYYNRGLPALLMTEVTKNAMELGLRSAETSGELESNIQVQQLWNSYDARQHKRRRAYSKAL